MDGWIKLKITGQYSLLLLGIISLIVAHFYPNIKVLNILCSIILYIGRLCAVKLGMQLALHNLSNALQNGNVKKHNINNLSNINLETSTLMRSLSNINTNGTNNTSQCQNIIVNNEKENINNNTTRYNNYGIDVRLDYMKYNSRNNHNNNKNNNNNIYNSCSIEGQQPVTFLGEYQGDIDK